MRGKRVGTAARALPKGAWLEGGNWDESRTIVNGASRFADSAS